MSFLRLHLAIAEGDRYLLTSIDVRMKTQGSAAELLQRFTEEFKPEQIKQYLAKEIISGLPNANALDLSQFAGLDVVRGKDRYTLKRAGKHWTLNGQATDSAAVARYLDRLKAITAAGFATPKDVDSTNALRAARRLTVRGGRGVLLSLACDSGATGFIVRHLAGVGGEGSTVYRMNTWDVDGITPASRSLVPAKK